MTDVPEHLLARSRERRAALGLGGGGEGGTPAPAAAAATGDAPGSAPATVAPAAAPVPVEAPPPRVLPPYVQAAMRRPKIPVYALPVLALLPVWAFLYFGLLSPKPVPLDPQLTLGATLYASNCSGCHGSRGEGGTGRPLDEVLAVFPSVDDHVAWVENGSAALPPGAPYGDPTVGRTARSDGYGTMPGFGGSLSEEEIAAIVRYERVEFGGQDPAAAEGSAQGESGTGAQSPGSGATQADQGDHAADH